MDSKLLLRKYGIALAVVAFLLIWSLFLIWRVRERTIKIVKAEMAVEYASRLEQYKQQLAEEKQAEYWLSGEASRESFINQEILVAAKSAGAKEMQNDTQKGGVILTEIARMLNPGYPDTIAGVAAQEGQIPFYSPDNTYTQHDWDIAEKIIRPLYENGIIPNGLNENYIYAEWTPTDYILRDQWEKNSKANYLRYYG